MTLTQTLHYYRCGLLIQCTTAQLEAARELLDGKISDLNKVMRHEHVAEELYDDRRQYSATRDEIARLLENRIVSPVIKIDTLEERATRIPDNSPAVRFMAHK